MPSNVPVTTATPAAAGLDARAAAGAVFALAGEAIIVLLAFSSVSPAMLVAGHVFVVAALAVILFWKATPGRDVALSSAICLAVAVAGPAGAIAALAAFLFEHGAGSGPDVLKRWYARLAGAGKPSPVTVIADRIASGRIPSVDAPVPQNFRQVIETGSLEERQKALGLIARRFHPDYAPILQVALNSPEPVVRVQAAAVVARVRDNLKADIKRLTKVDTDLPGPEAFERAALLKAYSTCDLVEPSNRVSCKNAAADLLENALSRPMSLSELATTRNEPASAAESFLLASGRYRDLRVLRRLRGVLRDRQYKLRRLRVGEAG